MHSTGPDPATPLFDVTFVVVDLETTGGSPRDCAITEVGAVKLRGGECLGTFQTLVNPGVEIPREIVYLTGITEAMVAPAPTIHSVLPALAEFIGDAVVVGHNVRFDVRFLDADLTRLGYAPLRNRLVDTVALARRLVRDEVDDCRLGTLARHFRTDADACHRALDDARATAEVLHVLLERAAGMGVEALDDLLALPRTAGHPQAAKLRWVGGLPRQPGVYLFRDLHGRVLFVGRASDLRGRVRSHFASPDRRRIGPLLREAHTLEHRACVNELEASVLEARLLQEHLPRYNHELRRWTAYRYVRVPPAGRAARPSVVRRVRPGDGCRYLGPVSSTAFARLAAAAISTEAPGDEQARALQRVVARQARLEALVRAGRLEVELDGGGGAVIADGRLLETWAAGGRAAGRPSPALGPAVLPIPADVVDEVACVADWLDRQRAGSRLVPAG